LLEVLDWQAFGCGQVAVRPEGQVCLSSKHNQKLDPLEPEPQLSDFYVPTDDLKDREIAFVILGMAATGLVAHKLA
jgi:hypothetical protein